MIQTNTPPYQSLDLELHASHSNPLIDCIDEIICGDRAMDTKAAKIAKIFLYPVTVFIGSTGNLLFISLSEKAAGDNTALKYSLVIGNVTSFGILTTYLALERLSEVLSTQTPAEITLSDREISTTKRRIGYLAAAILGSISEFPVCYMAYSNNPSYRLFAGCYVFLSNVSYPISSMKGSIFHTLKMRNLSEDDRFLSEKRDDLVKLIKICQQRLLELPLNQKIAVVSKIAASADNKSIFPHQRTGLYLSDLLKEMIPKEHFKLEKEHILIRGGRALVTLGGYFVAATFMSHYWEASRLATEEMKDNDLFNYSSAAFVTGCNAYLSVNFIAGSFTGLYDLAVGYFRGTPIKSLGMQFMPRITTGLKMGALGLAINTWGAPYQISRDYFQGNTRAIIEITSSIGNAVVANAAMQACIDSGMNYAIARYGTEGDRAIAQFCLDLDRIIVKLEQASPLTLAQSFLLWSNENASFLELLRIDQTMLQRCFHSSSNTPLLTNSLINMA